MGFLTDSRAGRHIPPQTNLGRECDDNVNGVDSLQFAGLGGGVASNGPAESSRAAAAGWKTATCAQRQPARTFSA